MALRRGLRMSDARAPRSATTAVARRRRPRINEDDDDGGGGDGGGRRRRGTIALTDGERDGALLLAESFRVASSTFGLLADAVRFAGETAAAAAQKPKRTLSLTANVNPRVLSRRKFDRNDIRIIRAARATAAAATPREGGYDVDEGYDGGGGGGESRPTAAAAAEAGDDRDGGGGSSKSARRLLKARRLLEMAQISPSVRLERMQQEERKKRSQKEEKTKKRKERRRGSR